ncbi:unnamed protein product [Amoebophrya sp. A120]|nr:unnamed protein product [Amoebophrya sp. A120]|eukprot:GSA120T00023007001.1
MPPIKRRPSHDAPTTSTGTSTPAGGAQTPCVDEGTASCSSINDFLEKQDINSALLHGASAARIKDQSTPCGFGLMVDSAARCAAASKCKDAAEEDICCSPCRVPQEQLDFYPSAGAARGTARGGPPTTRASTQVPENLVIQTHILTRGSNAARGEKLLTWKEDSAICAAILEQEDDSTPAGAAAPAPDGEDDRRDIALQHQRPVRAENIFVVEEELVADDPLARGDMSVAGLFEDPSYAPRELTRNVLAFYQLQDRIEDTVLMSTTAGTTSNKVLRASAADAQQACLQRYEKLRTNVGLHVQKFADSRYFVPVKSAKCPPLVLEEFPSRAEPTTTTTSSSFGASSSST